MNPAITRQLDRINPADHAAFIEYCEAGDAWEAISDGARGNFAAATRRMEKADKAWFATESYRNRPPLRHPDTGDVIG